MADERRPGDVTVAKVPGGFLVGQLLLEQGRGPWWAYLGSAPSLHSALLMAGALAAGARVWLQTDTDDWREVPRDVDLALL